jgi:hypothetical protein
MENFLVVEVEEKKIQVVEQVLLQEQEEQEDLEVVAVEVILDHLHH